MRLEKEVQPLQHAGQARVTLLLISSAARQEDLVRERPTDFAALASGHWPFPFALVRFAPRPLRDQPRVPGRAVSEKANGQWVIARLPRATAAAGGGSCRKHSRRGRETFRAA